jgi:UDP-N-acetylmuramoyl-tripeptide--D-alanyl-D-alanine ligase
MVELGGLQQRENALFARSVASVATDLVIVGRTNHRALHAGVDGSSGLNVLDVATRQDAVAWVRANTGPGDVVLYENDLPDHYP